MKKVILFLFVLLLLSSDAFAFGADRLLTVVHGGEHNYFRVRAEPGERVVVPYMLENRGDSDITNHILIYDSVTAVNGGNEVMAPDSMVYDETGAWFGTNSEMVSLGAGEVVGKSFEIMVPQDCPDGEYTAVFALYSEAETKGHDTEGGDVTLNINNFHTTTLAVVVEVGDEPMRSIGFGDDARIEISADGNGYLYVPVENSGNTYEFPVVSVGISRHGKTVFEDEICMDIVYRKTSAYACFETGDVLMEKGEYTLSAWMHAAGYESEQAEREFLLEIGRDDSRKAGENRAMEAAGEHDGDSLILFNGRQMAWISAVTFVMIIIIAAAAVKIGEIRSRRKSKP